MLFEYNGYELDDEALYIDVDKDLVRFRMDGDGLQYKLDSGNGWSTAGTGGGYLDSLKKIVLTEEVKKKWVPEIGKVYKFWDEGNEDAVAFAKFKRVDDGRFVSVYGTKWDHCAPIDEDEIGK